MTASELDPRPVASTGYWKIAPGENARLWQQWLDEGIASIGWDDLGDLTEVSRAEFDARRDEVLKKYPDWTKGGLEQVWAFAHIPVGDRVVANRGTSQVLGFGRVAGPYHFVEGVEYGHRLPVEWVDTQPRAVSKGGWRRTLIRLARRDYEDLSGEPAAPREQWQGFGRRAFELLEGLHSNPTAAYYVANRDDFSSYVEKPLQELFAKVALSLPPEALKVLETTKDILGRIRKNDFGKGGAYDFAWGAFYPREGKRIASPQLFVGLHWDRLRFGFSVGDYASEGRARLERRLRDTADHLELELGDPLRELGVQFGDGMEFKRWLLDVGSGQYLAAVVLPRGDVENADGEELAQRVSAVFVNLLPLFMLAVNDSPDVDAVPPEVDREKPDVNPPYTLDELIADTDLDRDTLDSWIRAIERKGQAILYGPPGTGKTYVAERLARHLVSLEDGITELVQFHPSYGYEDFVEGIRPQVDTGGRLTYELRPGRFLDVCRVARQRTGRSVLVIDEINRANLSRVLGELMYLLEYRDRQISLAGGSRFSIPPALFVIGTMNTADRSIAVVDHALRRRFAFLSLRPLYGVLRTYHSNTGFDAEALISLLHKINGAIADPNYEIGISYFLDQDLALNLPDIWKTEIEPYLEEHFFDQPNRLAEFRWDRVRGSFEL